MTPWFSKLKSDQTQSSHFDLPLNLTKPSPVRMEPVATQSEPC